MLKALAELLAAAGVRNPSEQAVKRYPDCDDFD
jgi:hypothetical protein